MMSDERKRKPWERQLKAALRRRAEREAEAFVADTPEDYLSAEELVAQKAKLMERIQAMEVGGESKDATARSDGTLPEEVASGVSPNLRALLERAGITLVSRGRETVLRLNEAALELLGSIYQPDAVRVRSGEDNLAEEIESALEGQVPVVATRLQVAGDGALLLNVQWVDLAPEQAPAVEVWVGGTAVSAEWEGWASDDLPKTLRIEAGGIRVKAAIESYSVVELTWNTPFNLLQVRIDAIVGADSD